MDPSGIAPPVPSPALPVSVLRTSGLPDTWEAFGRKLRAPKGTGFAGALEVPALNVVAQGDRAQGDRAQGGATARVLAWVFPKPGGKLADGGLYAVDEEGRASTLVTALPDFLPTGPDCAIALGPLGASPAGVSSILHVACKGRLLPGTATGAFVLADPERGRAPFILRLSEPGLSEPGLSEPGLAEPGLSEPGLAEPGGTEVLSLDAAGGAVSAHGVELTVHIDLAAPNGAHAKLPLRFIGKAGGLSRISDAPSADLEVLSKELGQLVLKKKDREGALARIDATRRWVYAVCGEAGTVKVTDDAGRALPCGAIQPSLDRLTEAAIEAYLFRDEPWKAIGEYERADFYLGAPKAATKARWAARIRAKTATVSADVVAEFPLKLGLDVPYPFASPLGYDERGHLYGLSASGDVLPLSPPEPPPAEPTGDGAPPQPDGEPLERRPGAWPLRPKSSDGRLLAALVPSCDRSEAQFTFVADGGAPAQSVALPLLAPRPCRGLSGRPLSAVPLAWQGSSLLAIASGEPVQSRGTLQAPQRPIAWGTSLGVEVWSGAGHASWRGPAVHDLHHCVAFSSGESNVERVACIRGRTAVELRPAAAK